MATGVTLLALVHLQASRYQLGTHLGMHLVHPIRGMASGETLLALLLQLASLLLASQATLSLMLASQATLKLPSTHKFPWERLLT